MIRELLFYKSYFLDFYFKQNKKTQGKIDYVLDLIRNVERVPAKFLKHIEGTDGIYEIRIESFGNIFRILSFFDSNRLVVLLNSFQKKTNKIPKKETETSERLKKEYFENKSNKYEKK
jgi:phage-related protein